jgi:hypothetical protein
MSTWASQCTPYEPTFMHSIHLGNGVFLLDAHFGFSLEVRDFNFVMDLGKYTVCKTYALVIIVHSKKNSKIVPVLN